MFKKGQRVIKILKIGGIESGAVDTIARKQGKDVVQLSRDEHLWYDAETGRELDPAPGFAGAGISSRIMAMDGE